MRKSRFKKVKKLLGLVLSVAFLFNVPMLEVNAEEQSAATDEVEVMECTVGRLPEGFFGNLQNARSALQNCNIYVEGSSEGMEITIYTGLNDVVPVVGIKDIRVYQKMWYGWKLVATGEGKEMENTSGCVLTLNYTAAVKDETYRITCVYYADLEDDGVEEYTEEFYETESFVYTYDDETTE